MELPAKAIFITHTGDIGILSLGLRFHPLRDEDISLEQCKSTTEVATSITQYSTELKAPFPPYCAKNNSAEVLGRAGSQKF